MKTTYLKPHLKVIVLQPVSLLTESLPTDSDNQAGEGGWGGPQSMDTEFEEE